MEFEQNRYRIFTAALAGGLISMLPSVFLADSDRFVFTSIISAVICFGYAFWMLAFAEKKKIKIDGLDLEFYDAGGSRHHFDFLKTEIKRKKGLNRTIELESAERKIRVTWLDFGHEAIDRILEYKNYSNKTTHTTSANARPVGNEPLEINDPRHGDKV